MTNIHIDYDNPSAFDNCKTECKDCDKLRIDCYLKESDSWDFNLPEGVVGKFVDMIRTLIRVHPEEEVPHGEASVQITVDEKPAHEHFLTLRW
jgi:hypothetical protein